MTMAMKALLGAAGMLAAMPAGAVTFDFVVGANAGSSMLVKSGRGVLQLAGNAYDPAFTGGVFVAAGDVNGDGAADIVTGAGATGGPHVKVFDGQTGAEIRSFFAYDPGFTGGVRVAAGDVNGDGIADLVTGAGTGGGPHVKVFDGRTGAEIRSFFAFDEAYAGGVRVAAGDVDGDGRADVIVGADQGASHVKVFSGATGAELASFFAFAPGANGGGVALGDYLGGSALFVGAGAGGAPVVNIFSLSDFSLLASQTVFDAGFRGGVNVAVGDVDGDGVLYAAMLSGGGEVAAFSTTGRVGTLRARVSPFGPDYAGGINIAAPLAVVPEPATWGLMIAGFGAVGGALRRRRKVMLAA